MNNFTTLSEFYDAFYVGKPYREEATYVRDLIERQSISISTLLDVGCGTGRHAEIFAEFGFDVTGIDLSHEMLNVANQRRANAATGLSDKLHYAQGDIRTLNLDQTFDAIVSLFHVISYQRTNTDVVGALDAATRHLKPGGIFCFDFWYGPGVLTDPPEVRQKTAECRGHEVVRTATPQLLEDQNCVEVNFSFETTAPGITLAPETHYMRYYFQPELSLMLNAHDFDVIEFKEWLTDQPPTRDTWNACCIARRR